MDVPLVGREVEARDLAAAVGALATGRGGLVLVSGEPGIGKTRLAQHAMSIATGARTVWVTCPGDGGAPPYWPWTVVLSGLGRDLPTPLELADPDAARFRFFEDVAACLREAAADTPVLAVIDDLHSADPGSVRLLGHLAPTLHTMPMIIVATTRPGSSHDLTDVARHGRFVTLGGMDVDALGAIVKDATGVSLSRSALAELHRRTDGNPLFARELARLGDGPVPDSITGVLAGRLRELSPGARRLIEAASVVGPTVRYDVLAAAVAAAGGVAALEDLDEAVTHRILRPDGVARWAFTHPLLHEVAHDELGTARQVQLHRDVGETLERLRDAGVAVDAADLARHFTIAAPGGTADKAVRYHVLAGQHAMTVTAYDEASGHFQAALPLSELGTPDLRRRADLLLALGDARLACGDLPAARETYEEVAALAKQHGWAEPLGRAALGMGSGSGGFEVGMFDRRQADALRAALELLDPAPSELRALLLARLSIATTVDAPMARPLRQAEEAVTMARAVGTPGVLASALAAHCDAIAGPAHAEARLKEASEVVAAATAIGDVRLELLGRRLRLVALLETGAIPEVDLEIEAFARAADTIRQPLFTWYVPLWRGMRALLAGHLDDAQRACDEAAAVGEHSDNAAMLTATLQMWLWEAGGRVDDAYGLMRDLAAGYPWAEPLTRILVAPYAALSGRVDEARGLLDGVTLEEVVDPGYGSEQLSAAMAAAWAIGLTGGHPVADRLYGALLPHRDRMVIDGIGATLISSVEFSLMILAAVTGRPDAAREHYTAAQAAHERLGAPLLVTRTDAEAARLGIIPDDQRPDPDAAPHPAITLAPTAGLVHEGDTWALRWHGRTARVRHVKGLIDLASLVAHPGKEVHVLDLVGGADTGDAGEVADAAARDAYRRRLADLAPDIEEARVAGDIGRLEVLQDEYDAIVAELSAAFGLSGRGRRIGAASEKARSAVTQRLKSAIARIETVLPDLGRHLRASVRTGTFCRYDPPEPVTWHVTSDITT